MVVRIPHAQALDGVGVLAGFDLWRFPVPPADFVRARVDFADVGFGSAALPAAVEPVRARGDFALAAVVVDGDLVGGCFDDAARPDAAESTPGSRRAVAACANACCAAAQFAPGVPEFEARASAGCPIVFRACFRRFLLRSRSWAMASDGTLRPPEAPRW